MCWPLKRRWCSVHLEPHAIPFALHFAEFLFFGKIRRTCKHTNVISAHRSPCDRCSLRTGGGPSLLEDGNRPEVARSHGNQPQVACPVSPSTIVRRPTRRRRRVGYQYLFDIIHRACQVEYRYQQVYKQTGGRDPLQFSGSASLGDENTQFSALRRTDFRGAGRRHLEVKQLLAAGTGALWKMNFQMATCKKNPSDALTRRKRRRRT